MKTLDEDDYLLLDIDQDQEPIYGRNVQDALFIETLLAETTQTVLELLGCSEVTLTSNRTSDDI